MFLPLLAAIGFSAETISFENPGIRLELFLKELSRQVGIEFNCPPFLKNEVLAASFHDQPLETVKTQLARVVHGTWEKKSDGWWLVQTSEQQKEERTRNLDLRYAMLKRQIDGLKKLAPEAAWTAKEAEQYWRDTKNSRRTTGEGVWTSAQRRALRMRSPDSRFAAGLGLQLKPEFFANDGLTLNFRRYSPSGLRNHIQLAVNISDLVRRFDQELAQFGALNSSEDGLHPANIEIAVQSGEIPFIDILCYDKNWSYVSGTLAGFFALALPRQNAEKFALSPETEAIYDLRVEMQLVDDIHTNAKYAPTYSIVADTMRNATTKDPLGLVMGRCWIDFARSVKKPLLVNLIDNAIMSAPKYYVPSVEQLPEMTVGMRRVDADNWVLGSPINPLFNRSWRLDRSLIRDLFFESSKRPQTVESVLRRADLNASALLYSHGLVEETFVGESYPEVSLFGVLGTLTSDQIQRCLSGARIPVTQLPGRGQDYLTELLSNGSLNAINPSRAAEPTMVCPSAAFPNGIAGMSIGATREMYFMFSFTEPVGEDFDGDGMEIETFAAAMKNAIRNSSSLLDKKFVVSRQDSLTASISLGEKSETAREIVSQVDDPTKYTWKTLPDSIRKMVLEKMDSMR